MEIDEIAPKAQLQIKDDSYDDLEDTDFFADFDKQLEETDSLADLQEQNDSASDVEQDSRLPLELYENDEIAAETQADNKGDGYDDLEEADFLSNLDEENDSISDVEEDSRLPLQIDALAADTQADRKADGYDELEETDFLATLDKQNGRRRKGISDTILLDTARSKQVNNPEAIATKSRGEKIVFQDSQVSKLEHKWPQLDKLKRFAAQDQMITEKP